MKRAEKAEVMNRASGVIDRAKNEMNRAVRILQENGMEKDARTLYNMIIRLEMFETKYDEYRW